jgi:hypothetical protein
MTKQLRVFLCHASQDKPVVRKLFARLQEEAWIAPWLDEEALLPGQDWNFEIQKELRETHAVIVCLSTISGSKEGYIQKEIRQALDVLDEKPDGTIFVIPLRLDECEIPQRLKKFHWVDYFNSNHEKKLLDALRVRADGVGVKR